MAQKPPLSSAINTKYHRLGSINNKHFSLTHLEAGKFKIKVLAGLVSGEEPFRGLQIAVFTLYLQHSRESREIKLFPIF